MTDSVTPFTLQQWIFFNQYNLQTQEWFDENNDDINGLLEEKYPEKTRHISVIRSQYLVKMPIQTYVQDNPD